MQVTKQSPQVLLALPQLQQPLRSLHQVQDMHQVDKHTLQLEVGPMDVVDLVVEKDATAALEQVQQVPLASRQLQLPLLLLHLVKGTHQLHLPTPQSKREVRVDAKILVAVKDVMVMNQMARIAEVMKEVTMLLLVVLPLQEGRLLLLLELLVLQDSHSPLKLVHLFKYHAPQ